MSNASSCIPPAAPVPDERGTMGRMATSRHGGIAASDLVLGYGGWQDFTLSDGFHPRRLGSGQPFLALGLPGSWPRTDVSPSSEKAGTLVATAASGAVGSAIGRLARIKEGWAVGIAGDADKCLMYWTNRASTYVPNAPRPTSKAD